MIRSVAYQNDSIDYILKRSYRKTVGLTVKRDGSVIISAPYKVRIQYIEECIIRKSHWIKEKQNEFKNNPLKTYIEGDIFLYLGKEYRLKIKQSSEEYADLNQDHLYVEAPNMTPSSIKEVIRQWYKKQAYYIFRERFPICLAQAQKKIAIDHDGVYRIKSMKSQWGSCSYKGVITLGSELACMPIETIDYVIYHELCHLKEMNHSKAFYALQEMLVPNWKKHKAILKALAPKAILS